jgi:hypothetical protein
MVLCCLPCFAAAYFKGKHDKKVQKEQREREEKAAEDAKQAALAAELPELERMEAFEDPFLYSANPSNAPLSSPLVSTWREGEPEPPEPTFWQTDQEMNEIVDQSNPGRYYSDEKHGSEQRWECLLRIHKRKQQLCEAAMKRREERWAPRWAWQQAEHNKAEQAYRERQAEAARIARAEAEEHERAVAKAKRTKVELSAHQKMGTLTHAQALELSEVELFLEDLQRAQEQARKDRVAAEQQAFQERLEEEQEEQARQLEDMQSQQRADNEERDRQDAERADEQNRANDERDRHEEEQRKEREFIEWNAKMDRLNRV